LSNQSPTPIALAGFGAWGQMHARAIAAIAEARLAAVYCHGDASADLAAKSLPGVRVFREYAAMLAAGGFEVVTVTVPNDRHAAFAIQALEAGYDVFLEKPLGVSEAECDEVIEASGRTGRLVALDHELRASHQWGKVREIITAGEIGKVRFQHFSLFRHPFRQGSGGWRYDPRRVGSWILEELVHFFDLVLWYAKENGPPAKVTAQGSGPTADALVSDFSSVLEWADGSHAVLTQCLSGFEHHTLLEVAGSSGAVRTWWSGAQDRTLTPDFELKCMRSGGEVDTLDVPKSGEVFELETNIRRALEGFKRRGVDSTTGGGQAVGGGLPRCRASVAHGGTCPPESGRLKGLASCRRAALALDYEDGARGF
jgi:myo-inositol 2-dehydrogenase / D-chiro-inositol 1-dehydrogenase